MSQNEKNLGGRPTSLNDDLYEKCYEYLDKPLFEQYTKEVVVKDQIQVLNCERPNWISVSGLAIHLGVSRASIYNWSDKKHASFDQKFLDIFEELQKKQELLLEYHGLLRGYDSGFAKFLASNLTKYREKVEHSIEDESLNTLKLAYNIE